MSSELLVAGFSIAARHMTCRRWFCIMSLMIPNSSKYPPRPIVPNGSLNVTTTLAILFLFHIGWRTVLANLVRDGGKGGREEGREGGAGKEYV